MANCQVCNAQLDGDFGVVSCSKCGEVNFVDSSADPRPDQTTTSSNTTSGTELAYKSDLFENDSDALDAIDSMVENNEAPQFPLSVTEVPSDPIEEVSPLETLSSDETQREPEQNPFEDVINYANSDSSQAEDGVILYDINISTVDSINQTQEIKKVLENPFLALDLQQIKAQMEKGVVEILNLNPAKASHIISHLKGFGLDIKWKQKTLLSNGE